MNTREKQKKFNAIIVFVILTIMLLTFISFHKASEDIARLEGKNQAYRDMYNTSQQD